MRISRSCCDGFRESLQNEKVSGARAAFLSGVRVRRVGIVVEPVTVDQAHAARQAFHDFGKGRHPAGLNYGDCFAYALAKTTGEPLLFKGEDFKKTDSVSAL